MRPWIGVLVLLLSSTKVAGSVVEVAGRVVDPKGTPIAGARVAENWFAEQTAPLEPNRPARTDADGRFSLEVTLYSRDAVVMAIDSTGGFGAWRWSPPRGRPGRSRSAWRPGRGPGAVHLRGVGPAAGRDVRDDGP